MEKYHVVNDVVQNHFNGNVKTVDFEYHDENDILIHIQYESDLYTYDYDFLYHKDSMTTDFLRHVYYYQNVDFRLSRDISLENEIVEAIKHS